jgi:hypothetical protein
MRVVVPDLEQLARRYLEALEAAWHDDPDARRCHAWAVLELYDQAVRDEPGGAMVAYLAGAESDDIAWARLGADGPPLRDLLKRHAPEPSSRWQRLRRRVTGLVLGSWRERIVRWLLGSDYESLLLGRFRRGGEVHRWMYDRISLQTLLEEAGFTRFHVTTAGESGIPGWDAEGLDTQPDGSPAKPDSLYVEAERP